MILYNTKTRKKEEFKPIDGNTVKMYSCGPTVYFTAHTGNLRAYIFVDVLKKALELEGYKLLDVMNITDVGHLTTDADSGEDKMEQSAREQKLAPEEIAQKYTDAFFKDCGLLNIKKATVIAPATKYISQMMKFVTGLEAKGFTYKTSDGIYFDSSKFPNYAAFSGARIEGQKAGARIEQGEKRNPHDFALWKFCGPEVIQKWDSPWGTGCPGWHLECSAIALEHLGETFDIHTGGIDHIPIHHTNEIAQTECLTGKPMANFWCHNEFMMVDGGKMGKSLGNAYTLDDLQEKGYEPLVFRCFVLLASYRSILNFTFGGLDSAKAAILNLRHVLGKHKNGIATVDCTKYWEDFKASIEDDLNTPKAIAVLWQMVKEPASINVYETALRMDEVLGLDLHKESKIVEPPEEVKLLAEKRLSAKKAKNFMAADQMRLAINAHGWDVMDTADGYELKLR